MKFAFWGSPRFASIILEKLIDSGMIPQVLVCNPDRPVGRKKIITPPSTKSLVLEKGLDIKIYQPEKKKDIVEFKNQGVFLGLDFSIVAAYSHIIPQEVLEAFHLGFVGAHPSLLPKYRGASPIQSVLLSGEGKTGVTLFLMDEEMDNGPIIAQRSIDISSNGYNYLSLEEKLAFISADLLVENMPAFSSGKSDFIPQDKLLATFTKKFTTEDGFVDLKKDGPIMIYRKIKSLNPSPGVYSIIDGKRTKIIDGKLDDAGNLLITKIVPDGRKEQQARINVLNN